MITVAAPAKINLYLHVIGLRNDGYHLLDSLVAFTDVGDEICVDVGRDLSLEIIGPFADDLKMGKENSIIKAALLLASSAGIDAEAAIRLTKNLPVASGIGGGSMDAAATLNVLQTHWNLSPRREILFGIAEQLGADVPVCLEGDACFIGGIGEKLSLAPVLPDSWVVLVNPGVSVLTQEVFKRHIGPFSGTSRFDQAPKDTPALAELLLERSNDLTDAAMEVAPVIDSVVKALTNAEGALIARLSGSGATCFGLFEFENEAQAAAKALVKTYPSWWIRAAPLLTSQKRKPDNR